MIVSMAYEELVNKAQDMAQLRCSENIFVEALANLIVDYAISNSMDIHDFDFKQFFINTEIEKVFTC